MFQSLILREINLTLALQARGISNEIMFQSLILREINLTGKKMEKVVYYELYVSIPNSKGDQFNKQ